MTTCFKMSLSDKRYEDTTGHDAYYHVDVKQAVKELKEEIRIVEKRRDISLYDVQEKINKIFGEDLK